MIVMIIFIIIVRNIMAAWSETRLWFDNICYRHAQHLH